MFAKAKAYYRQFLFHDIIRLNGRIGRKELLRRFLLINLMVFLISVLTVIMLIPYLIYKSGDTETAKMISGLIDSILSLVILYIYFTMIVRRLHDLGHSGIKVLYLLVFIIILAFLQSFEIFVHSYLAINLFLSLVSIYLAITAGNIGDNEFGKNKVVNENDWWDNKENRSLKALIAYIRNLKWKNDYLTFSGRLSCRDYFFRVNGVVYFFSLLIIFIILLGNYIITNTEVFIGFILISVIFLLIFLYPVNVRRNHDFGNSWVWTLLILIPGVNIWYLLRQFCFTGDLEENKYGEPRTWIDENGVLRNNDY